MMALNPSQEGRAVSMARASDNRTGQDATAPDDDPDAPVAVPQWAPEPHHGLVSLMDPVERRATGNNILFLSLYLILFAFFIVLNARADISTVRTEAVLSGLGLPVTPRPETVDRPMVLVADELEQRLGDIFGRGNNGHRYHKRTSSAHWNQDRLTSPEEHAHKRRMGWM